MRARQQTPSMLELCQSFKKRNEGFELNLSNGSEGIPCVGRVTRTFIKVHEEEERTNAFQTAKNLSRRSRQSRSINKAYETRASQEMKEGRFRFTAKRIEPRFSSVDTWAERSEFYESDDTCTESSSDEEYTTQAGPFQTREAFMKAGNVHDPGLHLVYRAVLYNEISQPQRDEKGMYRKQMPQERKNTRNSQRVVGKQCQGNCQNQANTQGFSRGCLHHPHSRADTLKHSDSQATPGYSRYQHQDRKGKLVGSQTTKVYTYLQQDMQRNEASSPQRSRNEWNNRETKLPPIQQVNNGARNTDTLPALPGQLRRGEKHQNCQALLTVRRTGRQEVCRERNQRKERRILAYVT